MANKKYIAKDIKIEADLTDYYTKAEVDAAIANVDVTSQLANYLPLTGGNINGRITFDKSGEGIYFKKSEGYDYTPCLKYTSNDNLMTLDAGKELSLIIDNGLINFYKSGSYSTTIYSPTKGIILGTYYSPFKDLYLSGKLSDGTNELTIKDIAKKSDIPSVDGLASETWVNQQGFLKEHQDISGKLDSSVFNIYKAEHQSEYSTLNDKVNTFLGTNSETLSGIKDLITAAEESDEINALTTALGNKADVSALTTHTGNSDIHVTAEDKAAWNNKVDQSQLDNYATKSWVENKNYLTQHQSLENYYNKTEIDSLIEGSDLSNYYNKTESDERYLSSTGGTINGAVQVIGAISAKNNSIQTYDIALAPVSSLFGALMWRNNGSEVSSLRVWPDRVTFLGSGKQDLALATESYVNNKIADLVNSAPEALDTLGELATALQNHEDAYGALLTTVGNKANSSDVYTKTEIDTSLSSKLDSSKIVYSETEPENPTLGMIWLKPAQ